MKKLIIFLFILTLFGLTSNSSLIASSPSTSLKDYHSITFYTETTTLQNYHLLREIILLPEGDFNENQAIQMIQRINNVDTSILKTLVEKGIHIKLFTGNLTDEPTMANLEGKRPRGYSKNGRTWGDVPGIGGSKLVLAKIGCSEKGKGHGSINLELHELGHTVDYYVYHSIRNDKNFLKTWQREVESLFPQQTYFIKYPEEYFAETFAYYYLSDETRSLLKSYAPHTYSIMQQLVLK